MAHGQIPTVGRIVHYNNHGTIQAAIISHVWSDTCVNLHIFANQHQVVQFLSSVIFGSDDNQWKWPERI